MRRIAKIVGRLISMGLAVSPSQLMCRDLQRALYSNEILDWEAWVVANPEAVDELLWIVKQLAEWNDRGIPIWRSSRVVDVVVTHGTVSARRSVRLQAPPRCRRTVLVNPRRMSPCFEETVLRAAADGKSTSNGGLNKKEVIRAIWAVTGLGRLTIRRASGRQGRRAATQFVERSSRAVRRVLRDHIDDIVEACKPEGEVIGWHHGVPVREVQAVDTSTHRGAVPPRRYQTRLTGQALKPATRGMTPQAMQRRQQQRDARVAAAAAAAAAAAVPAHAAAAA